MENRILLNKNISKKSTNVNNTVNVSLGNKTKLLPSDNLETTINLSEQYLKERLGSDIIRLTCVINPICSNVLFNNVTEIVKDEGSSGVTVLNYSPKTNIQGTIYKPNNFSWNNYEAVRDTQLSNEACGYVYHCGLDIFNNHLLRSTTFKTVCKMNGNGSNNFNTIEDMMRDADGGQVGGYNDVNSSSSSPNVNLHLYLYDEILNFRDTVSEKLAEENGWLGFVNQSKMVMYENESKSEVLDITKPINSKKACDFVDMYPERDLFSFNPKYNSFQNRLEKNWNYCLTYPSSSTTDGIQFIDSNTNSLKVIYFDENVRNYNGLETIVFYSVSKHGLISGDTVNIYNNGEIIIRDAEVISVTDDYIFSIFKNGKIISDNWIELISEQYDYSSNGRNFTLNSSRRALTEKNNTSNVYYVVNNRVNVDNNAQNISYKKTVNGSECKYYVRIFSRLPNWKFADKKPTEFTIYEQNNDFLTKYQSIDNEFENHLSKIAFAKNAYSDDISQIVFTDDIKINNLKDNLGRPLSDIYLTIIKNNKGYKTWYGKNKIGVGSDLGEDIINNYKEIEYSHCFGKVNCAFRLSDESVVNDSQFPNAVSINNVDNKKGLIINNIRGLIDGIDDDEIDYEHDLHYYGDLCCYSQTEYLETSIQQVCHRFNTAQRELNSRDKAYNIFSEFRYESSITSDDYDANGFIVSKDTMTNVCKRKEGYYYEPHYKIPIKSVSSILQTQYPKFFTIKSFKQKNSTDFEILTLENNYLELYDKFIFYSKVNNKYYNGFVKELITLKKFICTITDNNGKIINEDVSIYSNFRILKPDETIPSYAELAKDGTCRYFWREILQNGFDRNSDNEEYPFTNGAFYINKSINLYVKRQDSNDVVKMYSLNGTGMKSTTYPYDVEAKHIDINNQDNYYNDLQITC
jgi:hypothetical protein